MKPLTGKFAKEVGKKIAQGELTKRRIFNPDRVSYVVGMSKFDGIIDIYFVDTTDSNSTLKNFYVIGIYG